MATLHYVFDPLCGWCYAAAPLVRVARQLPGLAVAFHGGGMMIGAARRAITPEWRGYVMPHDRRIMQITGQPFGTGYFDGLLRDVGAPLDSEPPTTAVLAAEQLAGRGLDMIDALQRAHFEQGRRIAQRDVLCAVAGELGLDDAAFAAAFDELSGEATGRHFSASRRLLAQLGAQGFPSFALQRDDGQWLPMDASDWLGQPDLWRAELVARVAGSR